MTDTATQEPCGCIHGTRGSISAIQFCSLHKSAPDLLAALKRVMELLESGVLVRDITKDDKPDWGMRMMELVCDLNAWKAAIGKAEGAP